ncbi:MAG TPA: hypothetical protein PK970_08780 [Hyphomicrobiaceae bacterium]|nr:hypothetical protein [Hyphomicrobiaceae bacterium]
MKSASTIKHAALAAVVAVTAFAGSAHADRWHYLYEQRLGEHAQLINQGFRDGSLTFREMRVLRAEQSGIRRAIWAAKRDARLTGFERERIRSMQDAAVTHIYRLKNNNDFGFRRFAYWR